MLHGLLLNILNISDKKTYVNVYTLNTQLLVVMWKQHIEHIKCRQHSCDMWLGHTHMSKDNLTVQTEIYELTQTLL